MTIDPVTRIEGHARVVFDLDATGTVLDARLIVNELRGFERLLVGMEADRMPLITARICGVCPSAHHLAAVHALDSLATEPPPLAAKLLRELLYMGHIIHSHTLSLFLLQGPDLFLDFAIPEQNRNIVGVVAAEPELAAKALRLRSLGQKINEMIGGRGVHPVTAVPGGITFVLDRERHDRMTSWAEEALACATDLTAVSRNALLRLLDNNPKLATDWHVPTYQLATIANGRTSYCGGPLQLRDAAGDIVDEFLISDYATHFIEATRDDCYLKSVFAKCGLDEHVCRVGPLARVNNAESMGTPAADAELLRFRSTFPRPCHLTSMQIWARAIELVHAAERALEILKDSAIFGPARTAIRLREGEGIGHVEAPRGTLIHDYTVDDRGIVRSANLIVATQYNYAAINRSLVQAIGEKVSSTPDSALLASTEFAIRCYDPCLSCATHALGRMPLDIVITQAGSVVRTIRRPS
jgi:F420-non-reducing hydrogenase large subunit